jgi:hypothetical protein
MQLTEPHQQHPDWGKSSRDTGERQFLAGPRSRLRELSRAVRIFFEFIKGFRALHFLPPCVTVFGSARFGEDNRWYRLAREVSAALAKEGFTVMTGGGPGIMEAANRGARDVGGLSVGCNITLPHEQRPNPYVDRFVEFATGGDDTRDHPPRLSGGGVDGPTREQHVTGARDADLSGEDRCVAGVGDAPKDLGGAECRRRRGHGDIGEQGDRCLECIDESTERVGRSSRLRCALIVAIVTQCRARPSIFW